MRCRLRTATDAFGETWLTDVFVFARNLFLSLTAMTPTPAPVTAPVILVGHCGPDTSYLKMAIRKSLPGSAIRAANDPTVLAAELAANPAAILLVNRVLEPGFDSESGIELIASVKAAHPTARLLLVSNYPESQAEAVKAGALPGFGKNDIGSAKLTQALVGAAGL